MTSYSLNLFLKKGFFKKQTKRTQIKRGKGYKL